MPVDSSRKSLSPMEMLHVLIDQLVSLSSMVLANIRDAVTEAACSLGKAILGICIDLKEQIAVAERQIKAEESGASKASLKTNQKYTSLVKTRNDANKVGFKDVKFLLIRKCCYRKWRVIQSWPMLSSIH